MKVKIKKLWEGCVSLRSYIVEKAIERHEPIVVSYGNDFMLLSTEKLKKGKRNYLSLKSKINRETYDLLDFRWKPEISQTMF